MRARGKREAKRSASPLVTNNQNVPALKGRNFLRISAFQALISRARGNPGRRASRLPRAFNISRRWRSLSTFEAKPIKVLLTIHAQHRSDYLLGAIWPGCLQIVRPIARTTDKLENQKWTECLL